MGLRVQRYCSDSKSYRSKNHRWPQILSSAISRFKALWSLVRRSVARWSVARWSASRRFVAPWSLTLGSLIVLANPTSAQPMPPEARLKPAQFTDIAGWGQDDLRQVWPAFTANCDVMRLRGVAWEKVCARARNVNALETESIRSFFEHHFSAYELSDSRGSTSGQITGYYEPLLRGSRKKEGPFQFPIYRTPPDLMNVDLSANYPELKAQRLRGRMENGRIVPYPTRAEIETRNLLAGHELFWVDDAVEAFFLQVQGSGRIVLPTGETVRVGYAEQNGYTYRSIGRWLVEQGELRLNEASMQGIKAWVALNPHRRDELLHQNPSMVFFRELTKLPSHLGPIGSMGVPLTAGRSLAVDPRFVAMGTPVFLQTNLIAPGGKPGEKFQRLMLAQDTGSAILGAHRGDIFFGTGDAAGEVAGRMRSDGKMFVLLPR